MENISFKERVRLNAIKYSTIYKKEFVDKEYLIFSNDFKENKYYKLKAYENNYLHLLGVHTTMNPKEFFNKCLDGTLNDNDFDFCFSGKNENEVKGTVRRKIKSLKHLDSFFSNITGVEEKFGKGNISCAIAGSDNAITIGYANTKTCVPMTLLKGDELSNKRIICDILLSKNTNSELYESVIIGDKDKLNLFINNNKEIELVENLINKD